jgi:hypothetical protein
MLAPVPEPLVVAPPPPITKTPAEPQPVKEQRKRTVGERTIHVSSESVCDDADVIESSKFIMSFYTNTFTAKITPKLDTDNGSDYLFFPRQLIMSTGDGMNVVLHRDKETDEMHSLLQNQLPLCYVEQAIVHPRHPSQMRVTLRDTSGPGVKYTVTGRRVGFMPRIDDADEGLLGVAWRNGKCMGIYASPPKRPRLTGPDQAVSSPCVSPVPSDQEDEPV